MLGYKDKHCHDISMACKTRDVLISLLTLNYVIGNAGTTRFVAISTSPSQGCMGATMKEPPTFHFQ